MIRYFLHVRMAILLYCVLANTAGAGNADHASPRLFIHGGGGLGNLLDEFHAMAGREARLVVIPSALDDPDPERQRQTWQNRGFEAVAVLHAPDREVAMDPRFAGPLRTATAVWISGGVQQRLAALYSGTPVEEELVRLLDRGGVIGGSSAGASIQTRAMISSASREGEVLGGFDLLQGAVVDQHFLARNRLPRLMAVIRNHPGLIGYGIDEGTALVVDEGKMRVIGGSYVLRMKMEGVDLRIDSFKNGDVLPLPGGNGRRSPE